MQYFFIFLVLFVSLFLETTVVQVPLILISLLLLGILYRAYWIFPVAFGSGILLDVLSFRPIGVSSLFFTLLFGVLFLYARKFEIQSIPFILIFSFLSIIAYGYMMAIVK